MAKKKYEVDKSKWQVDLNGQVGQCPYCKSENVNFSGPDAHGELIYYKADCADCGNSYKEWYSVVFDTAYGYPLKTKKKGKK